MTLPETVERALLGASQVQLALWSLAALASLAGIAAGLTRAAAALVDYGRLKEAERLQTKMVWSGQVSDFTPQEIRHSLRHYITPDCAQSDPSNSRDLRKVPVVRESVMDAVHRFIDEGEDHKHLLILADTGMGKTTFCLNFFAARNARGSKWGNCAIIPLGRPNAIEKIGKVPNPTDTILLLDAFDEDAKAIEDSGLRIHELMSAASEFRAVIITCRSQFFRDDSAIPSRTGVKVIAPRKAGRHSEYRFQTLYLLPFDADQIDQYINKHFRLWEWRSISGRSRARDLIRDIRELSVRPMLLELVPELLKSNRTVRELFELYQFMIDSWLKREEDWIERDVLLSVSKRLATFIYTSRKHRATDRVTIDELHKIAKELDVPEDSWKHLSARSLLNRDSEGNFKFSHRSIMEYFFVIAAIDGDKRCFSAFWSSFMRDLFVSWGNTPQGRSNLPRALEILSLNLEELGLSPLVDPLPAARTVAARAYLQLTDPARRIPREWRATSVRMRPGGAEGHHLLEDNEYGLIWEIHQPSDYEDLRLVVMTHVELTKSRAIERLPSKEQFAALLKLNRPWEFLLFLGTFCSGWETE